ncbi:hypothetical protein PMIN06_004137 [Paraphaeosphaeria minitans]|uniref:Beta-lactamase family protein n=1 Tax=Paraphaeosphaeria minitans TaxID=565426 RepID=A0A9P6KRM6_9PLEO|nr:beta-lactamase family protein [Paraphaeosphaeria minitans]
MYLLPFFVLTKYASTHNLSFSPCPLLGPRFPIPTKLSGSPIFQSGLEDLTQAFDDYVTNLNGTFGPITSSTSFKFLAYFGGRDAVFAPGSTPIFSNAAFIILAYALESITGHPYVALLDRSILRPLNLNQTTFLTNTVEGPFNGLASTPHELTIALRNLLRSTLLPQSLTRRWLKSTSHTSNLVNTVGRPWEVYSLTATPISPVIPVYQVRGNKGVHASHIGLVPDYGAGFVILASGSSTGNPDLNAHADILASKIVPVFEQIATMQASVTFSGTYASTAPTNMTLVVAQGEDSNPGLCLTLPLWK